MMSLHDSAFQYLKPTDDQIEAMSNVRNAAHQFEQIIDINVPEGPDKTYLLRKFREVGMWANIAITRNSDGSPRT